MVKVMRSARLFVALLSVCALFSSVRASAQALDKAVLNSTVWISYETAGTTPDTATSPGNKPARPQGPMMFGGTGFLLFRGVGYTKGQIFLITNKHVLPPEGKQQDIKIRVVVLERLGVSKVENVSVPIVGADGKYLDSVRLHPDHDTDVAAVNIAPAAFGSKFQLLINAITTHKYLDLSMLMTAEKLKSLDIGVGSSVFLIGFPAAIFDPRNVSPILQTGIISTDPIEGYNFNDQLRKAMQFPEHVNGFLIGANVYPGSSGSLVVLAPENLKTCDCKDTATNKPMEWQPKILGIAAGSIPIFDTALHSYERIGLGIVFSADTIREVINAFSK